ncbi:MAG: hypothetical protein R3272_11315 [Candidatus Promineifilaceae bacterium]|nr:hypothetical protein [Candidatus Promineifilaceae bacterium]
MPSSNQIRQPMFVSALVWVWAIHHMPMFEGGVQISLMISLLSFPASVLTAYLAVYRRRLWVATLLLAFTLLAVMLYFNLSPQKIAEAFFGVGLTGFLLWRAMPHLARWLARRGEESVVAGGRGPRVQ